MPKAPSPKSDATRARILECALELFAEQGFAATTMRDIASAAGTSPGLAYRYYARKHDLAIALYARLAAELAVHAAENPPGEIAERFTWLMHRKLQALAPHRRALGGLAAAALDPEDDIGVFSAHTASIRDAVRESFSIAVRDASDAPADDAGQMAIVQVLYTVHLLLVLLWVHDKSEGQAQTQMALALAARGVAFALSFRNTPAFEPALAQIHAILTPLLQGQRDEEETV